MVELEARRLEVLKRRQSRQLTQLGQYEAMRREIQQRAEAKTTQLETRQAALLAMRQQEEAMWRAKQHDLQMARKRVCGVLFGGGWLGGGGVWGGGLAELCGCNVQECGMQLNISHTHIKQSHIHLKSHTHTHLNNTTPLQKEEEQQEKSLRALEAKRHEEQLARARKEAAAEAARRREAHAREVERLAKAAAARRETEARLEAQAAEVAAKKREMEERDAVREQHKVVFVVGGGGGVVRFCQ